MQSTFSQIIEAIRSAYGENAVRAQDSADAGYDPAFVERTAPLLEFLWARYFRDDKGVLTLSVILVQPSK